MNSFTLAFTHCLLLVQKSVAQSFSHVYLTLLSKLKSLAVSNELNSSS